MAYSDVILADSPFAYWRLGEPSGTTADNAEGTAAYDGTYTGSVTLGVTGALNGDADTAVDLLTSGYVDTGTLGSLGSSLGSGFSFEAFVKTSKTGSRARLFSASSATGTVVAVILNSTTGLDAPTGRIYVQILGGGNNLTGYVNSDTGVTDGNYHHLVVTADPPADTITITLDGVAQTITYSSQTTPSGFANFVGSAVGAFLTGGESLGGIADDASIYNAVLTSEQIATHYGESFGYEHTPGTITDRSPSAFMHRRYGNFPTYRALARASGVPGEVSDRNPTATASALYGTLAKQQTTHILGNVSDRALFGAFGARYGDLTAQQTTHTPGAISDRTTIGGMAGARYDESTYKRPAGIPPMLLMGRMVA